MTLTLTIINADRLDNDAACGTVVLTVAGEPYQLGSR